MLDGERLWDCYSGSTYVVPPSRCLGAVPGRPRPTEGVVISRRVSTPPSDPARPRPPVTAGSQASFGETFAVGEFRALWLAQVLSVAGDQLARVALTLLVFDQTGSSLLAAVTYATSLIPLALGGLTLSGLADRFPRREVMICCDLGRAALVAMMTLSGVPIAALIGLFFLATLISAPFASARAALCREVLAGDRYVAGIAITITTYQFAQVLGFAVGGAVVAFFGVRTSLLLDVASFVISAAIIRVWVRARPPARAGPHPGPAVQAGRLKDAVSKIEPALAREADPAFVAYDGPALPSWLSPQKENAPGRAEREIAEWTEAIRLDPDDAEAFRCRAEARREAGDFAPAVADCTTPDLRKIVPAVVCSPWTSSA